MTIPGFISANGRKHVRGKSLLCVSLSPWAAETPERFWGCSRPGVQLPSENDSPTKAKGQEINTNAVAFF